MNNKTQGTKIITIGEICDEPHTALAGTVFGFKLKDRNGIILRIHAHDKLAKICLDHLRLRMKVYVEGEMAESNDTRYIKAETINFISLTKPKNVINEQK